MNDGTDTMYSPSKVSRTQCFMELNQRFIPYQTKDQAHSQLEGTTYFVYYSPILPSQLNIFIL